MTSLDEFLQRFPTKIECYRHLAITRFGPELACPRCRDGVKLSATGRPREIYCPRCYLHVSPAAGTLFDHSRIDLWRWFYLMLLVSSSSTGMTVDHTSRQLGISRLAAYRMLCLIRLHMIALTPNRLLGGEGLVVQIDETWVRNVRSSNFKAGRGAIVFGMHDCDGVVTLLVPDRKAETFLAPILSRVHPKSTIVTDQHRSYNALRRLGFDHVALNHSRGEWRGPLGHSMAAIESYWTSLKFFLRSNNRMPKLATLPLYLAEHGFRHNMRRQGRCMFNALISQFPPICQDLLPPGANPKKTPANYVDRR